MDINKVYLRGRIASDIEVKKSKEKKNWCYFQICCNEYNPKADTGEKNIPTFINIACFNEHLTKYISMYARKGSRIDIEGKITVTKKEKNGFSTFYTNILMTDGAVLKDKKDIEEPDVEHNGDIDAPF